MRIIGELLILFLLFLTNGRVIFVKHEKRDSLVILAPVSVLLSVLQIWAWGLEFVNLLVFVISIIVLFSNFHALFRYSENLYIDHYSVLMKFWAVFTSILTIIGFAVCIFLFPISYDNKKLEITENKIGFEGSLRSGFIEKGIFGKSNLILQEFSPVETEEKASDNFVVLFVPDKKSETEGYKNYLQLLASKGYIICSYDLYVDEIKWMEEAKIEPKVFRRFMLIMENFLNPESENNKKNLYTNNTKQELEGIFSIIEERYGSVAEFFVIADDLPFEAAKEFSEKNSKIVGCMNLTSIPEYTTAGYGCVDQTYPLVAFLLNKKRDFKGESIKAMIEKTVAAIAEVK